MSGMRKTTSWSRQKQHTLYHVIYTYTTYEYVLVLYGVFNLLHSSSSASLFEDCTTCPTALLSAGLGSILHINVSTISKWCSLTIICYSFNRIYRYISRVSGRCVNSSWRWDLENVEEFWPAVYRPEPSVTHCFLTLSCTYGCIIRSFLLLSLLTALSRTLKMFYCCRVIYFSIFTSLTKPCITEETVSLPYLSLTLWLYLTFSPFAFLSVAEKSDFITKTNRTFTGSGNLPCNLHGFEFGRRKTCFFPTTTTNPCLVSILLAASHLHFYLLTSCFLNQPNLPLSLWLGPFSLPSFITVLTRCD